MLLCLFCSQWLHAEPARENEESLPGLELLEFLSEWQTDQGEFIDPTQIEQLNLDEQESKATRRE